MCRGFELQILDERKTKELKLLESSVHLDFNIEKQTLADADARLSKEADQQLTMLKQDCAKNRRVSERAGHPPGKNKKIMGSRPDKYSGDGSGRWVDACSNTRCLIEKLIPHQQPVLLV